ncbi:MAG: type I restriction endonuclease subunit R [Microcystis aeruginosa K13-05]|uniref:restriction endonuclease subunit S n=1 Tax=unclassified Microcystis TaxID=2643300 RepID=UPI0022C62B1A|nr:MULTISPECIES: restriction endonuclease subunit S [unclassified Microcystis]MCZ8047131.1 restriction endonuclease subunit S [Microcystis sp. LE19-41.2A]MCZ8289107.1 restriction endonuclease subunit S [Microcystis sp. LE19-59.1C]NCR82642.1 type I restriction endonuclease subunit R [Microcystis aeruginosa K13-10]NCR87323.1 type I restriction endonuclease subunit R [Microcystis aeruginosa K13-05]
MVTYAFKSDYTPEIPDDESEKLSTTIKLSEVLAAGVRLEASAFSIEAHNAVTALTNSGLPLIPLYGKEGLCQGGYYPHRFKRVYVSPEKGVPFLSSSEIISLRPKTNNFVSKNYTLKLDRLLPEKWDVLISRSGTIGNIGLATETFIGNALSEHVIRLQANEPETAGYVAAFLRSRYGRPQLIQGTFGSVVDQIEPEHLERVLIPDLPPIRRIEIGRLMCKAGELRDEANHLLDEADRLLHERLNLPYLKDITPRGSASFTTTIKASQLMGRLEASFHNPEAIAAEKQLAQLPVEITKIGDQRITKEVRAITKFRERTYVDKGGIPMLSSKQLFQVDPIDVKRLAKGSHTKDLPEIQLEENMIAVTRSGTIGKVQIIPKYMAAWTASEDATRILASDDINAGYLYAWLASDYGYCLMTRCSYGSVILEVDKEMFSSVHIPLPELSIRNEIGDLVLKANQLRDQAWRSEQEAISKLEKLISSKSNTPMNNQTPIESFSFANIKFDYNAEPIWELAARLSAKIPNEEWAKLPKDLAQNFDHYQQQQDS